MVLLLSSFESPKNKPSGIEAKINALVAKMTLKEKLGQLQQLTLYKQELSPNLKEQIKNGEMGSFLNVEGAQLKNALQKIAVEESRLKIPIIFGRDVIHGFRTIYPIPLGQASSWNPDLVEKAARLTAVEATSEGINWTFAPMVDIARDARWGRIAESVGEDPYLASAFSAAMVKGFQGNNLNEATSMAACVKHFVGYGAAEGGRDYNTAIIPENILRDVYLPSFKAAKEAGAATYMSSFNEINGIPASGNAFTLRKVLRDEWKFDGFVVSDWGSIEEMINHGFCADKKEAALKGFNAGVDMEMVTTCYADNLEQLIKEGKVSMARIDESVKNILRVKFRLGLFDHPYAKLDGEAVILSKENLETACKLAEQSMVLLKNENNTLPLSKTIRNLAVIGPLADDGKDQLGCWAPDGKGDESITPLTALRSSLGAGVNIIYARGASSCRSMDESDIPAAVEAARQADAVVVFAGEDALLSGEAHSRAFLNIPGIQEKLINAVAATGKPVVLVVMAGRPLVMNLVEPNVKSILYAWHPGTMAGPAVANVLFGKTSPSGKLPVTFVRWVGQIPTYYAHKNTGRPPSVKNTGIPMGTPLDPQGFVSGYLDLDYTPAYSFGYGLSYTTFAYKNLVLSREKIKPGEKLMVSAEITNTGNVDADEVVQLYIRDLVASVTRPVKELKGFKRVSIKAGETVKVEFTLTDADLAFYNDKMKFVFEPGKFNVWISKNADEGLKGAFELVEK